jgi:hypothetical protein
VSPVAEVSANLPKRLPGRKYDRQFFFLMTMLQLAVVGIGFAPTFLYGGRFSRSADQPGRSWSGIQRVDAASSGPNRADFSANRVAWHRKLGVVGFLLACVMVVVAVLTAANVALRLKTVPNSEPILSLLVVPFTDAFDFAVLVGFAYATPFVRTRLRIRD